MLARNEAEDIVGAIKEGLFFAENVWVIVDPDSIDETVKIIKKTFKTSRVHIEKQIKDPAKILALDPSAGTEFHDESFTGHLHDGSGRLYMHWNITYWTNQIVKPGEWWHWISPDERFAPRDYHEIWYWVRYAQEFGYEAVYTVDHLFVQDEVTGHSYDWCIWFTNPGTPHHFLKMTPAGWKKGLGAHTGCTLPELRKRFKMPVSHYHFAYIKSTRIPFKGPRDHPEYQFSPRYQFYNPMNDEWRDLPDVDCEGNLIPPMNCQFDLPHAYKEKVSEIQTASSVVVSLQQQLQQKRDEIKALDEDNIRATEQRKMVELEFARIERVKNWKSADITALEQQITETEKKLCPKP